MLSSIEQELGLTGLFEGEHNHLTFDCPKPLAKLFKEATKANGTSICKELQKFILSYVVKYGLERHAYGSTLSKVLKPSLTIENLNFEQYVQNRPRRYMRNVEPALVNGNIVCCGFRNCNGKAVAKGVWKKHKAYLLCEVHLKQAREDSRNWQSVEMLLREGEGNG